MSIINASIILSFLTDASVAHLEGVYDLGKIQVCTGKNFKHYCPRNESMESFCQL